MENSKLYKKNQDYSNSISDNLSELASNSYKMGMAQVYAHILYSIQCYKFSTDDISKLIYAWMKNDEDIKDCVYEIMKNMDIK